MWLLGPVGQPNHDEISIHSNTLAGCGVPTARPCCGDVPKALGGVLPAYERIGYGLQGRGKPRAKGADEVPFRRPVPESLRKLRRRAVRA